uniref:Uncharacterized protein n=1 Tax=Romanomermis culicivorax TaxID=13658 RepID=A0A915KNE1_ROMCU
MFSRILRRTSEFSTKASTASKRSSIKAKQQTMRHESDATSRYWDMPYYVWSRVLGVKHPLPDSLAIPLSVADRDARPKPVPGQKKPSQSRCACPGPGNFVPLLLDDDNNMLIKIAVPMETSNVNTFLLMAEIDFRPVNNWKLGEEVLDNCKYDLKS